MFSVRQNLVGKVSKKESDSMPCSIREKKQKHNSKLSNASLKKGFGILLMNMMASCITTFFMLVVTTTMTCLGIMMTW